jgi:hypothetical protein
MQYFIYGQAGKNYAILWNILYTITPIIRNITQYIRILCRLFLQYIHIGGRESNENIGIFDSTVMYCLYANFTLYRQLSRDILAI